MTIKIGFKFLLKVMKHMKQKNIKQSQDEHLAALKCCVLVRGTELLLLYATDRTTYIFLHPAPPHSNPTHRSLPHSLWDFMDVLI